MPDSKISADPTAVLSSATIFPVVTPGSPNANEKTTLGAILTAPQITGAPTFAGPGSAAFQAGITVSGAAGFFLAGAQISGGNLVTASGINNIGAFLHQIGAATFNENAGDSDFRIEGGSLPYAFFLDASTATENLALLAGSAPNWQTMDRGVFLGDASTVPTGNPASGVFVYSESGSLKWRNSGGNVVFPEFGTYSPTFTAVANCDSTPTGGTWFWMRIGSIVLAAGRMTIDATATALTQVGISLPIASSGLDADSLIGSSGSQGGTSGQYGVIYADAVNDRAEMAYTAQGTAAVIRFCWFMYRVM